MKYNSPIFALDFNWITMKKFYFVAAIMALITLGGCSKSEQGGEVVANTQTELSIALPSDVSRTAIDANGKAAWVEGDTFALWAENAGGEMKMDGAKFSMMYLWQNFQSAVFTANTEAIEEGQYTYYAVSPMPKSYADYKATFTIPAHQQGDVFNGAYDIMVATPIQAEALATDQINNLTLDFQHKMHILKVNIAKNELGVDVGKLVFTFPGNVTGDVVVNITKLTTSPPSPSDSSKQLVIDCGEGANVGDDVWGVIYPQMIFHDVKVTAYGVDGRQSIEKSISFKRQCIAGHITPLSFSVPQVLPTLRFSIGTNNLGEEIEKLTITASDGKEFVFTANEQNRYDYVASDVASIEQYKGKTFTATFESKSAIVSSTFKMPSNLSGGVNVIPALTVPYLLFEDFSCIHTAGESYGDNDVAADERNQPGVSLDKYMSHKGWNAARFLLGVGTCPRINVRYQVVNIVMVFSSCHHGRLDTPALSNLKDGASVKIRVEFDAGGVEYKGDFSGQEIMSIGLASHTNTSNPINGIPTGTESFSLSPLGPIEFSTTLNDFGTTYAAFNLAAKYSTGSFGDKFPTYTTEMEMMTNSSRICFYPYTSMVYDDINNNECAIYIDNIKVSIAK